MATLTDAAHPAAELLLAAIHAEAHAAGVAEHVAACDRCRERSRSLRDDHERIGLLLDLLDHPLATGISAPDAGRRILRLRRAMIVAGAAATLAIAAAAATIPANAPLHHLLRPAPSAATPGVVASPAATPAAELPVASGIAIHAPAQLVVIFRREQSAGMVELTRAPGRDVAFHSRGGTTAYDVAAGRVVIDNQVPAESYDIAVPAMVRTVRIVVGKRTLLQWPRDSARLAVPGHASLRVVLGIGGAP